MKIDEEKLEAAYYEYRDSMHKAAEIRRDARNKFNTYLRRNEISSKSALHFLAKCVEGAK